MPMNPEQRRPLRRVPPREWVVETLAIALPIVIGAAAFAAPVWLGSRGGSTWFGLTLAGAAALAKPALVVMCVLEERRLRSPPD